MSNQFTQHRNKMPDKNASRKRQFYIDKLHEIENQCDENALTSLSIHELKELQSSLKSHHEKFENKCLAVQCDNGDELSEEQNNALKSENKEIDALCLQLKAKIGKRLADLVEKKYALPKSNANAQIEISDPFKIIEASMEDKSEKKIDVQENVLHQEEKNDCCVDENANEYGQAYKNVQKALKKFYEINHMQNATSDDMSTLLSDMSAFENSFATTTQENKFNTFLMLSTIEKFDKDTKRVWERFRLSLADSWAAQSVETETGNEKKANQHIPSFDDVKEFMRSEIKILKIEEKETMQTQQQTSNIVQSHAHTQSIKFNYADITKMAHTGGAKPKQTQFLGERLSELALEKNNSPDFLQCKLCPGIHPAYKCKAYLALPLHKRMEYALSRKFCVRCMRSQHIGDCADPKSNKRCPDCKEEAYHNSTLCDTKAAKKQQNQSCGSEDWD